MFIPGVFFWGGNPPKKETYNSPQTAAKLCALNLFFGQDNELQIYRGNFLLMNNKHGKLFVIKQSQGCKLMPKMHRNAFGDRAPPRSTAGEFIRTPDSQPLYTMQLEGLGSALGSPSGVRGEIPATERFSCYKRCQVASRGTCLGPNWAGRHAHRATSRLHPPKCIG